MEVKMQQQKEHGGAVQVRVRGPLFEQLENWRRSQPKIPSRSEALRLLIEQALADRTTDEVAA
jgi:hypothetical protein